MLHEIEGEKIEPIFYEFGTRGPPESDALIKSLGYFMDPQSSEQVFDQRGAPSTCPPSPERPGTPASGARLTPL
jgi:hypothetical protein